MCDRHNLGLQLGSFLYLVQQLLPQSVGGGGLDFSGSPLSPAFCVIASLIQSPAYPRLSPICLHLWCLHIFFESLNCHASFAASPPSCKTSPKLRQAQVVSSVNPPGVPQGRIMKSSCKSNELLIERNNNYTKRWTMFFLIDTRIFVVPVDCMNTNTDKSKGLKKLKISIMF